MKRKLWICVALFCVLALCACDANVSQQGGDALAQVSVKDSVGNAPNFVVLDAKGNAVQLSDFAGKPVVLNFWATWCKYCVMEMPDFDKAYAEYPDVVFLMINATDGVYETKEKADAYVQSKGFSFDVYYDVSSTAQAAYKVSGYPTTVFINANGDVVTKEVGAINYDTLVQGIRMISE